MSYLTIEDFEKTPQNVRITLVDRTNFLACALGRNCTTCGAPLSAYSSKIVNVITGEINCGHDDLYKEGGGLQDGWCTYSDG